MRPLGPAGRQHMVTVMVQPPFPFSAHPWLPPTPSASSPCLLPPLCSNSKAYSHNLYNYIMPTLGLAADQYRTHLDLVPMPMAAIYIPFLHLSYLPDPFSLTITGNYIRKCWVRGNRALRAQGDKP